MVRLIWLLAICAGPAAAGCFGPPFPKTVHFEGGRTVQNLSHTAQDLTYRSMLPDGAPVVITMRSGLFLMASSSHGATYSYNWITPLPDLAALAPGFHQTFKADMTVEHASRSFYETEVQVIRADVVHLGGCDYPVLVVHRTDRSDGRPLDDITLWLSTTLRFALQIEAKVEGKTQTFAVESME